MQCLKLSKEDSVIVKTLGSWRCQHCWVFWGKSCATNRAGVRQKSHAGCKQQGHRNRATRALESLHHSMLCSGFRSWDYRIQCLPFQILFLYWSTLLYYFSVLPFDMEMLTVPLCIGLYKFSLILQVFTTKRCSWVSKETMTLDFMAGLEWSLQELLEADCSWNDKIHS